MQTETPTCFPGRGAFPGPGAWLAEASRKRHVPAAGVALGDVVSRGGLSTLVKIVSVETMPVTDGSVPKQLTGRARPTGQVGMLLAVDMRRPGGVCSAVSTLRRDVWIAHAAGGPRRASTHSVWLEQLARKCELPEIEWYVPTSSSTVYTPRRVSSSVLRCRRH